MSGQRKWVLERRLLAVVLARQERPLTGTERSKPLEVLAELHDGPGCLPERLVVELLLPARLDQLLVDVLWLVTVTVELRAGAVLPGVQSGPGESHLTTGVQHLEALAHHRAEHGGLLLRHEVETEDLLAALISPLVEVPSGLVVPQAWPHITVENHLVTGHGDGHHSEGLLLEMMKNVDEAHEAGGEARWNPFLAGLIVQHHLSSGPSYA